MHGESEVGSERTGTLWKAEPKFWLCDLVVGPTGSVIPVIRLRPGVGGRRQQREREGIPPMARGNARQKMWVPPGQPWSHCPERGPSKGPAEADVRGSRVYPHVGLTYVQQTPRNFYRGKEPRCLDNPLGTHRFPEEAKGNAGRCRVGGWGE